VVMRTSAHERQLLTEEVERIRNLGSMFAIM
jgi:hypothetical protein